MEDSFQLKVTPAAENDLDELYYYISNSLVAPQAADNLLDDIEKQILSLCEFPHRCELSRNDILRDKGYRKLVIHNYVVLYLVDDKNKNVIVMRVFFGAMDYEKYV
ncbi:MAG: type II toxin-antitoxin system RelE/ParE family toxin [Desulfotomaculaceae bacterium]|nr:type II toxin-antitoxin system RelE/ParE family toxin [Desulfotomaculaceae bacterium]